MDGAMQSASKELGEEALILNTRESPKEFRHYGKYEVVCAVAQAPAEPAPAAAVEARTNRKEHLGEGQPRTARLMFLVGPSGAGKTSSCAKIAIHSKFSKGSNPAVISWDSGRVGGADFLRAYCDIAGLPFRQVVSRQDFFEALDAFADNDLLVVDTPSLGGCDSLHQEIIETISKLPHAEIHLVLSGAFSKEYLTVSDSAYQRFSPGFLLPTHLDEARMDLNAEGMDRLRTLAIRWCGTGRSVPEDLEDARLVVQKAEALSKPQPVVEGFQVEAMELPVDTYLSTKPAMQTLSARKTIDSILARFRRADQNSRASAVSPSKSSAA